MKTPRHWLKERWEIENDDLPDEILEINLANLEGFLHEVQQDALANPPHRHENELLNDFRHEVEKLKKEREKLMITADTLKASSDALTAAVTGAIALIGTPAASTPDTVVKAFQSDVDAQTARLNSAEAPPPPPPPTP